MWGVYLVGILMGAFSDMIGHSNNAGEIILNLQISYYERKIIV
jgi:hypothetical protein